jgi:hypothetical protein
MIGKRAMLMVNMTGLNPSTGKLQRTGEVHEVTLTHSLYLKGESFPINKSANKQKITMTGTIDKGSADIYSLRNSTFSCVIKTSDGITAIDLVAENDPAKCVSNGVAFKTYEVSASADGGTVTFEKCQPNSEPNF